MGESFRLIKTGQNEAGYPVYKRENIHSEESDEYSFELSENQRRNLRRVLMAIGIALMPMKDLKDGLTVDDVEMGNIATLTDSKWQPPAEININGAFDTTSIDSKFEKEIEAYSLELDQELEAILEYAEKPVVGADTYKRIDYVSEKIEFTPYDEETGEGVPPVVALELQRLMPGLCAQESKFNASLVSKTGAKGIFQFMPETWEQYGGKENEYTSLRRQVEVAGKFFSDLHKQLYAHIDTNTMISLQNHFDSKEQFERDLLVPLIINSYHAGAARVAEAVNRFVEEIEPTNWAKGKDLFLSIADFAKTEKDGKYLSGYKKDSGDYVAKVYANLIALNNLDNSKIQLASID